MGVNHTINKQVYERALEKAGLKQHELATRLGEPPQSLSRWINNGYPADKIRSFARELQIKPGNEFRTLIGAPVYRIFFRKKYNGSPPDSSTNRAVELARFWFHWEDFRSDSIAFPNLSGETSSATVANIIRGALKLSELGVTFESLCIALQRSSIVVVPLSFSFFDLKAEDLKDNKECAVTVFDNVSKYVILLDTDANAALLTFNLCHELSHIFRPEAKQGREEETLCNKVGSEIMYPDKELREILRKTTKKSPIEKLKAIHAEIGGSRLGITLALKERDLLPPREIKQLWTIAKSCEAEPEDYKPSARSLETLLEFFNHLKPTSPGARPYIDFRMAAIEGQLSGRKLADYLGIESHEGIVLVDAWKSVITDEL